MEKFDSIIFDLDGTLWNTIDSALQCLKTVKNKHSDILHELSEEDVQKYIMVIWKRRKLKSMQKKLLC